jgi:hypothetical protein
MKATTDYNSTYPKDEVYLRAASRSCSADFFVVNQTLVFQIITIAFWILGEIPTLQKAENR